MTLYERGNYFVAVAISLLLHLILLLIYIPGFLAKSELVTAYPIGMVEFAASSELQNESTGVTSAMPDSVSISNDKIPEQQSKKAEEVKDKKTVTNPVLKTKPKEETAIIPKKEGIAVTEAIGKAGSVGGNKPEADGLGVKGDGAAGKPLGFGTGEGMVTVLGPKPNYPKNAQNEEIEGKVAVRVLVKKDGSLEKVNLTKSSGDYRLDKVAISSIERNWKFKAASRDYFIDLIFNFNMETNVTFKFLYSESRE